MNVSRYDIRAIDYENVIGHFVSEIDNRTKVIADKFNLSINYTSYIIDFHLSLKKNYMGDGVKFKKKKTIERTKIEVTDLDTMEVLVFPNMNRASNHFKVSIEVISKKLRHINNAEIYHSTIKKKLRYKKL